MFISFTDLGCLMLAVLVGLLTTLGFSLVGVELRVTTWTQAIQGSYSMKVSHLLYYFDGSNHSMYYFNGNIPSMILFRWKCPLYYTISMEVTTLCTTLMDLSPP